MKIKLYLTALFSLGLIASQAQSPTQCVSGNCQNGFGKAVYGNGEYYIGHFDKGQFDGQGVLFYNDGNRFIGSFSQGVINGDGSYLAADGSLINMGSYENGVKVADLDFGCINGDCENGIGTKIYKEGHIKFIGRFENGEPTIYGTFFYPDGAKYIGEWKDGKKNGNGTYYAANMNVDAAVWSNDKALGVAKQAIGCVEGDCVNGTGKYVFLDRTRYEGEFRNGQAHGTGFCAYADGDMYLGEWKSNAFNGNGKYYHANGTVQQGIWVDNMLMKEAAIKTAAPTARSASKRGQIYVVIVGVSKYTAMPSLKFTDDDAFRLSSFYGSPEGGALSKDQRILLIDGQATKAAILEAMKAQFSKAGPNDMAALYFSGHGLKGAFLPSDYDGTDASKLYHSEIAAIMQDSEAKMKLCIADACHSGSFEENVLNSKSGNSASEVVHQLYSAFERSTGGTALFLSSKATESSIENNGLRQGVFSHYLMKGLGGAADRNFDNLVTIEELAAYVTSNVKSYTGGYQNPVIYGQYDDNTPVSGVRE